MASLIPAGIGLVAAESVIRPPGWLERTRICTLAGFAYGIGWVVALIVGSLFPGAVALGMLLCWTYMIAAPILWFLRLGAPRFKGQAWLCNAPQISLD